MLNNCAVEPEVLDLVKFLRKLGSNIKIKKRKIEITGQDESNKNIKHKIIFDRIEAGTYLIAGALIGKSITITNVEPKILKSEVEILKKIGAKLF